MRLGELTRGGEKLGSGEAGAEPEMEESLEYTTLFLRSVSRVHEVSQIGDMPEGKHSIILFPCLCAAPVCLPVCDYLSINLSAFVGVLVCLCTCLCVHVCLSIFVNVSKWFCRCLSCCLFTCVSALLFMPVFLVVTIYKKFLSPRHHL